MKEVMSIAVLAYRSGKYKDAIELLLQTVQEERENWLAWFYLGMSYGNSGQAENAHKIFKIVAASCPDEHLRIQAKAALPALQAVNGARESKQTKKSIGRVSIG
jgi:TolA-binding protein